MKNIICIFLTTCIFSFNINAQKQIYFNDIGYFNDDLAPVLLDNKWGFVDAFGEIVIEPKIRAFVNNFGDYPSFSEGLTRFIDPETERIGYMNRKGGIEIAPQFYSANNFYEDVAFVRRQNDHVLIDKSGNVIAENFVAINGYYSDFSNGRAIVQKQFNYGYIDKAGTFVIEPIYDEVRDFSSDLAAVKKDDKWGFIDLNGNTVIPFQFSKEPKSFNDGRAFIQGTNNKWGLIDEKGSIIIEPIYDEVFTFSSGAAVVSKMDEKWQRTYYIIDVNGKAIKTYAPAKKSNETITFASGFVDGLAVAVQGYKKGFVDPKGNVVLKFNYRELSPLSSGMSYFEKFDEKTKKVTKGYLNKSGKEMFIIEQPKF